MNNISGALREGRVHEGECRPGGLLVITPTREERLLINAKLPLLLAIALIKQMIRYYPIESSLEKVEDDILRGRTLHEAMQQFKIYLSKMIQLIKVGEETNQLDYFFGKISELYRGS